MQKAEVLSILRIVNAAPRNGSGDFVGAIYDTTSQEGNHSVALLVGINFGQRGSSATLVGALEHPIHYAKHVLKLTGAVPHHTVIWNFYPYLTSAEWLDDVANAADEAKRLFESGYVDTFAVFSDLVTRLDPTLIVFHGVSSGVPILARIALRRVRRAGVLVPNLSRGLAPVERRAAIA